MDQRKRGLARENKIRQANHNKRRHQALAQKIVQVKAARRARRARKRVRAAESEKAADARDRQTRNRQTLIENSGRQQVLRHQEQRAHSRFVSSLHAKDKTSEVRIQTRKLKISEQQSQKAELQSHQIEVANAKKIHDLKLKEQQVQSAVAARQKIAEQQVLAARQAEADHHRAREAKAAETTRLHAARFAEVDEAKDSARVAVTTAEGRRRAGVEQRKREVDSAARQRTCAKSEEQELMQQMASERKLRSQDSRESVARPSRSCMKR